MILIAQLPTSLRVVRQKEQILPANIHVDEAGLLIVDGATPRGLPAGQGWE